MLRLFYVVLSLLCIVPNVFGQEGDVVDSLKRLTGSRLSNIQRVDIYNALAEHLWHSNPQQAALYADSAYQLVSKMDYPEGQVKALGNKGIAAYTDGKYQQAENFYKEAIEIGEAKGIESEVYIFYFNLLKKTGDYHEIIRVATQLLPDSSTIAEADPVLLRALIDSYIELGLVSETDQYIRFIIDSKHYREKGEFYANTNVSLSDYYVLKGRYDSALAKLNVALEVYDSLNDKFGTARVGLKLGTLLLNQGDVKQSSALMVKSLHIYDSLDYDFGVAEAKRNLGSFYSIISNFQKASELLFEALEIYEEQDNLNEVAKTYNELSWVYQSQGSYETAKKFIEKSVNISRQVGNKPNQTMAYNILGTILDKSDSLEAALEAYRKAYELSKDTGDKKDIAASMYNIGFIKEKMEDYDGVLRMYQVSYNLEKEIGNVLGMAISEYTLGNFYSKLGNYDSAEYYLDLSRKRLIDFDSKGNLLFNYMYSAKLYERMGEYKKASDFYKKYITLKDSLISHDIASRINELEVRYDLQNKDREIAYLNLENKAKQQELSLKEKTISNQQLVIWFSVLGAILLAILLFVSYRLLIIKNKSNKDLQNLNLEIQEKNEEITAQAEELQEANFQVSLMNESLEGKVGKRTKELKQAYKELDTFFYRSSHDFRRPLTTFLGLAEVAKSTLKDEYSLDLFDKVQSTALQLDKMVNKLKAISLITADSLQPEHVDLKSFISNQLKKWEYEVKEKRIDIEQQIETDRAFISYPNLLEIIFDSLLENSIQYCTEGNPFIKIKVFATENGVNITVEDNGQGIDRSFQDKVFDMYFRANETSDGNGLGLYLVKKTVDRLKGTINLKSKLNEGTTISIYLPDLT